MNDGANVVLRVDVFDQSTNGGMKGWKHQRHNTGWCSAGLSHTLLLLFLAFSFPLVVGLVLLLVLPVTDDEF